MKRIILIPALVIIALLLFSCKKNEKVPRNKVSADDMELSAVSGVRTHGYVLRVNASLYTLENDTGSESDRTKWAASMTLGEKLEIGKSRRVTFAGDGKIYDFTEVRRDDGTKGLAWTSQIAVNGELAVVVDEKANLYKSPKAVDVTGALLPRKTVVVLYPESENNNYVEIKAYDPEAQVNRSNFIRLSSLSEKQSDIQSSILLQTAQPLKNEGAEKIRKDALLETALLDYPDSVFNAEIQALANPNASNLNITVQVSRFMLVNDNNVNVRDIPDSFLGNIVGHLTYGDKVSVSERTLAEATIEGQRAFWYHITDPFDGWVFGAFLE